jgi:hypothetical protein
MTHEILADWDTLMRHSKYTAEDYFVSAHGTLKESGLQYTAADVIALAKVMADDFHTAGIGVAAQKISEALAGSSTEICEALGGINCTLDDVAEGVAMLVERSAPT